SCSDFPLSGRFLVRSFGLMTVRSGSHRMLVITFSTSTAGDFIHKVYGFLSHFPRLFIHGIPFSFVWIRN
ncbi:hypothetical protein ACTQ51_12495, partial [Candidatus Paralachnospira sp. LCP21S3_H12]|uniref:hypothetical protein n=1 Tax=Candidatus Paralachnospira sp. LCP21S3_H12 TaxID=3438824 RepID=UPI003F8DAE51